MSDVYSVAFIGHRRIRESTALLRRIEEIAYVSSEREEDNAYRAMKYAESKGVRVLNLADSFEN